MKVFVLQLSFSVQANEAKIEYTRRVCLLDLMAGLCGTSFVCSLFYVFKRSQRQILGFYQPTKRFCHLQLILQQ